MPNAPELYRAVGEAMHLAQALELSIRTLIGVINDSFGVDIDVEGLIVREDKRTLGKLIAELKRHGTPNEGTSDTLKNALKSRNYIAHSFFIKNNYAFTEETEYERAYALLSEHTKSIAMATVVVDGFVQSFCDAMKIDPSSIKFAQDT